MKLNLILVCLISILFSSCGKNELEKHLAEFKECSEKKKEEKKYKYNNIQEALNAYDFEVARDYLACHPNKDNYYSNGKKAGDSKYSDNNPYQEDLQQIVTAEITYFVSQGEYKKAETTAKEANLMEIYEKISGEGFEEKMDEMIQAKEFEKIFKFLTAKRDSYQKSKYDLKYEPNSDYYGNKDFNESSRSYNSFLDKILVKYKYKKVDKTEINAIIDLGLPELIERKYSENGGNHTGSKLLEIFKKEAPAKYLK